MILSLGHVGVWAGVYVVGALVMLWELGGFGGSAPLPRWDALLAVLLLSCAAYALDRVKLRDAWIDPPDEAAQPERYAFLRARAAWVRAWAIAALGAGSLIGWRVTPAAPIAAGLIVAGVSLYAMRPLGERRRPKDVLIIKNAVVSIGITGFVLLAAIGADGDAAHALFRETFGAWWRVGLACGLVLVRVFLDAALCDIDDEPTDKRYGTETFATELGGRSVWRYAGVLRAALCATTLLAWACPWRARVAWFGVSVLGTLALRVRRPRKLRDPVDLRLALEAGAAALAMELLTA